MTEQTNTAEESARKALAELAAELHAAEYLMTTGFVQTLVSTLLTESEVAAITVNAGKCVVRYMERMENALRGIGLEESADVIRDKIERFYDHDNDTDK